MMEEAAVPDSTSETQPRDHRVKLNVGGKLFETTASTLHAAGPDSLLAALSLSNRRRRRQQQRPNSSHDDEDEEENEDQQQQEPIFIDRDPEIFSVLLSILRTNRIPTSARRRFSKQDLLDESLYYGIDSVLRSAMSPPPLLGIDASLVSTVRPSSDASPTAISAGIGDGSLWIAHGGQISSYDWSLSHLSTVRTHLDDVSSLRRLWTDVSALGSLDSPGLHFYHVSTGRHLGSAHWSDPSDPRVYKARVTSLAADPDPGCPVFASFECPHRENCILSVDRSTLKIASEVGRQSGSSMKVAAPTKLVHLKELGLIFASAVSSGAFGYSGYMKLWDPRSGEGVWETVEPGAGSSSSRFGDAFAGTDVDGEEMKVYKVCWKSGDLAVADLRKLGDDPWVYLEDVRSGGLRGREGGGENSVVCCYRRQVFVNRENGLEVWSQVAEDGHDDVSGGEGRRYRRNYVDGEEDAKRGRIRMMEGGGERLFLTREAMEGVEVWETTDLSGAISVL